MSRTISHARLQASIGVKRGRIFGAKFCARPGQLAGRSSRSLQPSRQSMSERHREASFGTSLAVSRCTRTRRIKFYKLRAKLRPTWRRSRTRFAHSCTHNQTAKNRFALSFLCRKGPAKAAPRGYGT